MRKKTCPQCKTQLKKVRFDVGFGVLVPSMHCTSCGNNITDEDVLKAAMKKLRKRMQKQVKVVAIGEGLGIRFPKEFARFHTIKKGDKVTLESKTGGISILL